jgi:hypothetical protein
MKDRILKNWNLTRVLYLVIGIAIIIQSITNHQWLGVFFGGYFASMGLFAFGCASGNCFGGDCQTKTIQKTDSQVKDIEFEEIK